MEKIRLYAERNRILLPKEFIFVDEGISGRKTKNRPAFNEMIGLAKCNPKPFDVILVWKFSRFARNREDSIVYKSMLRKERNIDVVSVSEDIGDDTFDVGGNNLVFYVGASRARFRLSIIVNMSDDECKFVSEILGNTLQGKPPKKMLAASLNALLQ